MLLRCLEVLINDNDEYILLAYMLLTKYSVIHVKRYLQMGAGITTYVNKSPAPSL